MSDISAKNLSALGEAFHTPEGFANEALTPGCGCYPRPHLPRRVMAHMLGVTAFEVCHPMFLIVLMESDDLPRHARRSGHPIDAPSTDFSLMMISAA